VATPGEIQGEIREGKKYQHEGLQSLLATVNKNTPNNAKKEKLDGWRKLSFGWN